MPGSVRFDGGKQVGAVGRQYESVAANLATVILGGAGAVGDTIDCLWIFPATLNPGGVTLFDGAIPVWSWPAGIALTDLRPIFVPLNLRSVSGPWNVTTSANLSVLGIGIFT